jgi:4-deoxy-L-threo-5-hexosulose-uronate ketol-isomerase
MVYTIKQSVHSEDAKQYDTARLRKEFLVENIFQADEIALVYSLTERFIVGGAYPVNKSIKLECIDVLKSAYFLERREMGIINIAGDGVVIIDGHEFNLNYKEALYIGRGNKEIIFKSKQKDNPAKFYINSAPAHTVYPIKKVTLAEAEVLEAGALEQSNARRINKLIVNSIVETCQLQMGLTELKPGSVWNTMPPHLHDRRNEVYFYFGIPEGQALSHFMGEPTETRHIWVHNEQAVISPVWSIHSGCGTANYNFIWGMAGENLDYTDMDTMKPIDLK